MTKSRKLAYLALLVTSVIWGFAPPVIKYSLNFISPVVFLFYRFLFTSMIFIIPLIVRLIKLKPSLKELFDYLWIGFIGTPLSLYLLFVGIQKTSAIEASLISIISPILVVIGGVLFLKEKVTKMEQLGIILALAGTIMALVQPIFESGGAIGKNISGNLLVLLGTITWAGFTLLTKKQNKKLDSFTLSSSSFILGLILITPLIFFEGNLNFASQFSYFSNNLSVFLGIVGMVVFGSVIAYTTYIYGVSKIEASEATIFTYLQPVFAIPFSMIFLKETVSLYFWVGAFFIMAGVFICEYRYNNFKTQISNLKTEI